MPVQDAGVPCPGGEHRCGAACVPDNNVNSCGDRCVPCPTVENATATCNGACGFTCNMGFQACLGACVPDGMGPCGVNLPANTWVKLTDWNTAGGDTGPRNYAAMAYDPMTSEYVLMGGTLSYGARPRPYDIQGLTLGDPRWKNHYPPERAGQWGPDYGNAAAPFYGNESWGEVDGDGVVRPNWQLYPGAKLYFQHAFNAVTGKAVFYLWNHTFLYDVRTRAYTFVDPPTDPAGGPDAPRLLWGAMAFDAVDNKVLLFGGANVLNASGQPGTWLFDVATSQWRQLNGVQPGPRALSPLVTDPDQRKALLFGGDELDRLLSDTWAFDFATETWAQLTPSVGPQPRGSPAPVPSHVTPRGPAGRV